MCRTRTLLASCGHLTFEVIPDDEKDPRARTCLLCLEDFSPDEELPVKVEPCGHVFGRNCIEQWTKQSKTCPHCRDNLEDASAPADRHEPSDKACEICRLDESGPNGD